jgi:hypothetical protein
MRIVHHVPRHHVIKVQFGGVHGWGGEKLKNENRKRENYVAAAPVAAEPIELFQSFVILHVFVRKAAAAEEPLRICSPPKSAADLGGQRGASESDFPPGPPGG